MKDLTIELENRPGALAEMGEVLGRAGVSVEGGGVFVVNGVTNRDLVTGQSTAGQLNARSVAEVNVATGAYDVRYGNALSGVVEITLKEGGEQRSTGLTLSSGTWGARQFQVVSGGPDRVWKPLLGRLGVQVPGSVSSILDVSGTLYETRFRYLGAGGTGLWESMFQRLFDPSPFARLHSGYEDSFLGWRFHYGDFFTPSQDNRWALRYGLTWKPTVHDRWGLNLSKRIAIDQGFSRTFITARGDVGDPAYPWQWSHRIGHAVTILEDNVQSSVDWKHTLSASGFTSLQLSRYFSAQRQDVLGQLYNDPHWKQPEDFTAFDSTDARRDDYFWDTGDDSQWQDRRTTIWGLSGSVVQRVHRHEVELGFEHQAQTVQYATIEDPWVEDIDGLGDAHDLWIVHPWVGDLYARDRLDYEGFTGNLGVRADYWFLGREAEAAVADPNNPNITPETRARFHDDTRSFFGRRYKLKVSPRVIVAHPITETSSFFFNYGQFTQNPSYRYVYSKLNSVSSESFPLLGNPNLNPQVSVNYELGAKYQFLPQAAANVTFFVKDLYDYPASTLFKPLEGRTLQPIFVYLNGHFARSRGFEIEFQRRRSRWWSGKITYTYQQTRGKSSDPNEQKVVQEEGGDAAETRLSETFVDWNRPHKLSADFDLRFEDTTPERWEFLKHFGLNVYIQGVSGRAYTPSNPLSEQAAEPNSKNAPFQLTTDLRLNRSFGTGRRRFDLSLLGTNIFDNHIINRVDPVTGLGRVWGAGSYDPALFPGVENNTYIRQSQVDDPSNYGPGAEWRLQLDYDF